MSAPPDSLATAKEDGKGKVREILKGAGRGEWERREVSKRTEDKGESDSIN